MTLGWRALWERLLTHRLMVQLRPLSIRLIEKLVLLQVAFRGLDYVLLPDNSPPVASLFVVERALPLDAWGWGFLGWGIVAHIGMWWVAHPLAALGHFALSTIYGIFAFGSLIEIITRDGGFFGWRTGTGWAVAALIHLIFAREAERTWRVERGT